MASLYVSKPQVYRGISTAIEETRGVVKKLVSQIQGSLKTPTATLERRLEGIHTKVSSAVATMPQGQGNSAAQAEMETQKTDTNKPG